MFRKCYYFDPKVVVVETLGERCLKKYLFYDVIETLIFLTSSLFCAIT